MPYGYLVVSAASVLIGVYVLLLLFWGWRARQFQDVERPKWRMLEQSRDQNTAVESGPDKDGSRPG